MKVSRKKDQLEDTVYKIAKNTYYTQFYHAAFTFYKSTNAVGKSRLPVRRYYGS